ELRGQHPAEVFLVLRARRPGFLLGFAVVVRGQLGDRLAEYLRQHGRVLGQERPHGETRMRLRAHRAISQVVPSFESLSTTPMAASSSRMRSDSLKSFALRAAARASISA